MAVTSFLRMLSMDSKNRFFFLTSRGVVRYSLLLVTLSVTAVQAQVLYGTISGNVTIAAVRSFLAQSVTAVIPAPASLVPSLPITKDLPVQDLQPGLYRHVTATGFALSR